MMTKKLREIFSFWLLLLSGLYSAAEVPLEDEFKLVKIFAEGETPNILDDALQSLQSEIVRHKKLVEERLEREAAVQRIGSRIKELLAMNMNDAIGPLLIAKRNQLLSLRPFTEKIDGFNQSESIRRKIHALELDSYEQKETIAIYSELMELISRKESIELNTTMALKDINRLLEKELLWTRDSVSFSSLSFENFKKSISRLIFGKTGIIKASEYLFQHLNNEKLLYGIFLFFYLFVLMLYKKVKAFEMNLLERRTRSGIIKLHASILFYYIFRTAILFYPLYLASYVLQKSHMPPYLTDSFFTLTLSLSLMHLVRCLAKPEGFFDHHLLWNEESCRVVQSISPLCKIGVSLLLSSLVFVKGQTDIFISNDLGRLLFMSLLFLILFALKDVRFSDKMIFLPLPFDPIRTSFRWKVLAAGFCLLLVCLSAVGYSYAAQTIALMSLNTILYWGLTLLFNSLAMTWLLAYQRSFVQKVSMARRELQEAGEEINQKEEDKLEFLAQLNLQEIRGQSRDMLKFIVQIFFIAGLYLIWAEAFPALGYLQEIKLWSYNVELNGSTVTQFISIWNVLLALTVMASTIFFSKNLLSFFEMFVFQKLSFDAGTHYAIKSLLMYGLWALCIILTFNTLGVGWDSIQWFAAALTVGLGFGLQEIFANFISGLILLIERPIRIGDTVTVGNVSGVVHKIRIRATSITDWDQKELIVPNKNFITNELVNWTLSDALVRLKFNVGIAYGSDTALAHRLFLEICQSHDLILKAPGPQVLFNAFGDNSLNFEIKIFVTETSNAGRSKIIHDLHMQIDQACRTNGIEISFPQRDLHLKSSDVVFKVENVTRSVSPSEGAK